MRKNGSHSIESADALAEAPPKLDEALFAEADAFVGPTLVRRGPPRSDSPKQPVSIRLDPDVVAWFKRDGEGWQTRNINELRKVAGI